MQYLSNTILKDSLIFSPLKLFSSGGKLNMQRQQRFTSVIRHANIADYNNQRTAQCKLTQQHKNKLYERFLIDGKEEIIMRTNHY